MVKRYKLLSSYKEDSDLENNIWYETWTFAYANNIPSAKKLIHERKNALLASAFYSPKRNLILLRIIDRVTLETIERIEVKQEKR